MKNNHAITLIALVITIIVLLILVGITLSLMIEKNGILNYAKKAELKTQEESAREKLEFVLLHANIEKINNENYNNHDFLTALIEKENMYVNEDEIYVDGFIYVIDREKLEIVYYKGKDNLPIITAKEVYFTPNDPSWEVTTVHDALEYLYHFIKEKNK